MAEFTAAQLEGLRLLLVCTPQAFGAVAALSLKLT